MLGDGDDDDAVIDVRGWRDAPVWMEDLQSHAPSMLMSLGEPWMSLSFGSAEHSRMVGCLVSSLCCYSEADLFDMNAKSKQRWMAGGPHTSQVLKKMIWIRQHDKVLRSEVSVNGYLV